MIRDEKEKLVMKRERNKSLALVGLESLTGDLTNEKIFILYSLCFCIIIFFNSDDKETYNDRSRVQHV